MFDFDVIKYTDKINGYQSIFNTKLYVITGIKKLSVATHYKLNRKNLWKSELLSQGFEFNSFYESVCEEKLIFQKLFIFKFCYFINLKDDIIILIFDK